MVKRTLALPFALLLACSWNCSTSKNSIPSKHDLPFEGAMSPRLSARAMWQQELDGKLTDLSVSTESGHILTTQVYDGRGPGSAVLSLRDRSGKILWTSPLDSPVRSQAISSSGDWIIVGTYEDELIRIDTRSGKQIWKTAESGMCRPKILEKSKQILCHHDDDSVPGIAFTVLDSNGRQRQRFKIPQDLLVLRISQDESRIALGMVKGRIWILGQGGQGFQKVTERQVEGEIVDLALSSGPQVEWSALVNVNGVGQKLLAMPTSGRSRWEQVLDAPHQQIEISDDGSSTAIYGNGPRGQFVSLWGFGSAAQASRLLPLWSYRAPRYADYNQRIDLSGDDTVLGFEEVTDRTRHSHVVAIHRSGVMDWDIPVQSEEGAYLYARGFASKLGMLVVGTDDGRLSAYEIRN